MAKSRVGRIQLDKDELDLSVDNELKCTCGENNKLCDSKATWIKDGEEIEEFDPPAGITVLRDKILFLTKSNPKLTGSYQCRVGRVLSAPAKVRFSCKSPQVYFNY